VTRVEDAVFSTRRLNRATLARQLLLERERVSAVEAVARLAGLQAQLPRPPFIGLWSRIADFDRTELTRALHARSVVRATMMRGTLHLATAADYLALRPALQPSLTRGMQSILKARAAKLDVPALVASARTWFDQKPRTFDELRAWFQSSKLGDERALAYAVRMHLPLVQVPTAGAWGFDASSDFAVAESWIGGKIAAEAPANALVLRYLAAFGPATAADAQVWSGAAALQPVFERLLPNLVVLRDERGRELFDLPDAPRPSEDVEAPVRFLPDFDNLVLSHADRRRIVPEAHRGRIVTKNLQVRATFLVDGFVAGTWRGEKKKGVVTVVVEPFGALAKATREALAGEGEHLARFLEPDAGKRAVRFEKPSKA
jgi:hypothetical protein